MYICLVFSQEEFVENPLKNFSYGTWNFFKKAWKVDFFLKEKPGIAWNLNFRMEKQPRNHI